jgi:hypothetical protein
VHETGPCFGSRMIGLRFVERLSIRQLMLHSSGSPDLLWKKKTSSELKLSYTACTKNIKADDHLLTNPNTVYRRMFCQVPQTKGGTVRLVGLPVRLGILTLQHFLRLCSQEATNLSNFEG